ncbi:hypothetical protein [Halocalculus aciditolerans]|uniref:CARDB domain-containing protein n=1 Tax=Halocalculus aciditolerans TaxID=1383812 RepID=A0A830FAZ7_9EURY|nr:hypothetical protein [Halocalculus aciditolerans]GGL71710.1 hypothetical protein GCM10009039_32220 [Halocalculus aciditolerans]
MSLLPSTRRMRSLILLAVLLSMLVVPMGTVLGQGTATAQTSVVESVNGSQIASSSTPLTVTVNRSTVHARTGDVVNITSTVHNTGNASTGPVTVYLTLMDVKKQAPLDLEDWAATRSHQITSLGSGHATAQSWSVKAIKGGTYRVYIVAVPSNASSQSQRPTAVSDPVDLMFTQSNNLNPGNVLPTILGVPVGLLVLAGAVITVRRRQLRPADEPDSDRSGGDDR